MNILKTFTNQTVFVPASFVLYIWPHLIDTTKSLFCVEYLWVLGRYNQISVCVVYITALWYDHVKEVTDSSLLAIPIGGYHWLVDNWQPTVSLPLLRSILWPILLVMPALYSTLTALDAGFINYINVTFLLIVLTYFLTAPVVMPHGLAPASLLFQFQIHDKG